MDFQKIVLAQLAEYTSIPDQLERAKLVLVAAIPGLLVALALLALALLLSLGDFVFALLRILKDLVVLVLRHPGACGMLVLAAVVGRAMQSFF